MKRKNITVLIIGLLFCQIIPIFIQFNNIEDSPKKVTGFNISQKNDLIASAFNSSIPVLYGFVENKGQIPQIDIDFYSTYLGGDNSDYGFGMVLDNENNVYITGEVSSTNFPVKNALYPSRTGIYSDAFITKLNSTGNGLFLAHIMVDQILILLRI